MTLDVRHGNVYVGNRNTLRALRVLTRDAPDAVVINEGRKALRLVAKLRGYRPYVSPYGTVRGRTDVIVLVRRKLPHLGQISLEISKAVPGVKVAHQRFVVAALFRHPTTGPTAVVGWHPSPGPKALAGTNPNLPIVREYMRAVGLVSALVDWLHAQGYSVVLAGDVQVRRGSTAAGRPWSPYRMLSKSNLDHTVNQGLDLMAASKQLQASGYVLAPAGARTGSDHAFLRGIYTRRRAQK